ncbi:MAG: flavin-containing monooxygenase [Xanthobacteraceae bacterium]
MTSLNHRTAERHEKATIWLAAFGNALECRDYQRAGLMIHADGYWRDLLTFGWEFKNFHGVPDIVGWLAHAFATNPACDFHLRGEPVVGAIGDHKETLEFFFTFDTPVAAGHGFVRLVPAAAPRDLKAFTILTAMKELKVFPERVGRRRLRNGVPEAMQQPQNSLDPSQSGAELSNSDPDVLVIGAGQSGLMAAARLQQLNVRTLLVDKSERLGDVWRKRYRTLKLHNEICMNHFPYLHFPESWPVYIPKDKLADWFELYATAMDLKVWLQTTFLSGVYEDEARRWTVRLRLADNSIRILHPRHLIMAMGVSGIPHLPHVERMDRFKGHAFHSSGESDDLDVKGKSVLVVGAGTSGHDIAQDMHRRGGRVTMLQRSPVTVVSLEPSSVRPYEVYRRNEGVRPLVETDMMAASVPYNLLCRLHVPLSRQMAQDDADLLEGLRKVGFLLDNGEDDTGYFVKLLRYQAGYYLNVGASDLIVQGKIKLKSGTEIKRVTQDSVIFTDGTKLKADLIVFATGYRPLQDAVRSLLGDDVADRVGPIWGIGADNELRAMYARTGQEGFYVVGGGFMGARVYSPYTAMLIKADLEGLLEPRAQRSAWSATAAPQNARKLERLAP